jgi:hypothetical protein
MINLNNPEDRDKLASRIEEDIDAYCAEHYDHGHRNHLGASDLGEECWRKLWYNFRWTKEEVFDGRMLRLFNVGHQAEPRFVSYLRGIGFEVKEFDENRKQFHISGAKGHYGGSLDGMCKTPKHYEISEDIIISLSFKTNNTGSGYNKVAEEHLSKAKPKHWAQECQYGYKTGIRYCIYMIENKNDSDITVKIVELDWNLGAQLEKKAEDIIFAKEPPPRISENPSFFNCKYCNFSGICHKNEPVEINCRSCRNAEPIEDAQWYCHKFNNTIPKDFISKGCDHHLGI